MSDGPNFARTRVDWDEYVEFKNKPHDQAGREIPDPTPIAPPIGYVKQPHLWEQIRNMVRSEALRMAAEAAGAETFEESDDFDVDDDFDPRSPFEEEFEGAFQTVMEPPPQAPGGGGGGTPSGSQGAPGAPSGSPTPPAPHNPAGGSPSDPT